ncbi:MAG: LamG domain-containing protein [Pseudomonadota bacterium]
MTKLRCWLRTVFLMAIMIMGLSWVPVAWADLSDGLVAYYPFEGNVADESGNANHGVRKGHAEFRTGIVGKLALYLDGDGDYVELGNDLNLYNEYSVSVWIKTEDATRNAAAIIAKYETNHYGPYDFQLNNDKASLWISSGTGSYKEILSNASISEDAWTYITFVGQNGTFKIFLNGVLDTNTTVPNMTQNNDAVTIGRQALMFSPENELQFKGYIDDLRIYNRVLSES